MYSENTPIAAAGRSIPQYFIIFFGICIVFFYFPFWGQLISAQSNDQAFADYFGYVIQLAGRNDRPAKELYAALWTKAQEMSLPIEREQIQVTGTGRTLKATVHYEADINLPIITHPLRRVEFVHTGAYTPPFAKSEHSHSE